MSMERTYIDLVFIRKEGLSLSNLLHPYFMNSPFCLTSFSFSFQSSSNEVICSNGHVYYVSLIQLHGSPIIKRDQLYKGDHHHISIEKGLAVIDEVERVNGKDRIIKKFAVNNGVIFECPDLLTLLNYRISSSLSHVHSAMKEVYSMFEWNVQDGMKKKIASDVTETEYIFKASELKSLQTETLDDSKLQNMLLEALLSEIGVTTE